MSLILLLAPEEEVGGGDQTVDANSALATWVVPTPVVSVSGTVTLTADSAIATWVIPTPTVSVTGSATIAADTAITRWIVPHVQITGGTGAGGGGRRSSLGSIRGFRSRR